MKGNFFLDDMDVSGKIEMREAVIGSCLKCTGVAWGHNAALSLTHAKVKTYEDDGKWPAKGNLDLDYFTYEAIDDASPLSAYARLEWLERQEDDQFRPQPYEQLAKVLREAGHEVAARDVLIAKNEKMHWFTRHWTTDSLRGWYMDQFLDAPESELIRLADTMKPHALQKQLKNMTTGSWLYRLWLFVLKMLMAYGYKPQRVLMYMAAIWLAASLIFWGAYVDGGMTTMQSYKLTNVLTDSKPGTPEWDRDHHRDRSESRLIADDYPHFYPPLYALDVLLPLVGVNQENFWLPNSNYRSTTVSIARWSFNVSLGDALHGFQSLLVVLGWVLTGFLAAGVTGIIKK